MVSKMEACSDESEQALIDCWDQHGFIAAVRIAHSDHVPLCISPDHVWTLIVQGFSQHLKFNLEGLQAQFEDYEGELALSIRRDDFIKGDPSNDWKGTFNEFS